MQLRNPLQVLVLAAGLAVGAAAMAAQGDGREIPLKDGSTLIVFKDGKMSMRDAEGRAYGMKDGMSMQTRDGEVITMKNNEAWRRTHAEQDRYELYRGA